MSMHFAASLSNAKNNKDELLDGQFILNLLIPD